MGILGSLLLPFKWLFNGSCESISFSLKSNLQLWLHHYQSNVQVSYPYFLTVDGENHFFKDLLHLYCVSLVSLFPLFYL